MSSGVCFAANAYRARAAELQIRGMLGGRGLMVLYAQRVKKIDITRSVAFLHNGNIHYLERFFDINTDAINTFENREALSRMQPRRACL